MTRPRERAAYREGMTGETDSARARPPRWLIRRITRRQLVTDIVLAAGFFLLFGFVSLGMLMPVAIAPVIGVFMAGALGVRRLSPALALTIAWIGAILQMWLGSDVLPSNIAIFGVLYVTAAYGTTAVMWIGFGSAVLGAFVAAMYLTLYSGGLFSWSAGIADAIFLAGSWFLSIMFALLLSWTVGALVRSSIAGRATRLAQERAEAEAVAEQERGRIARDMHDVVAHSLAVVVAQADGARYAAEADPKAAQEALVTISQTARAALADVRLLLAQLRHRQADGPQPTLADLETLFAQVRAAGVELRADIDPAPPGEAPAAVQLAVYRILQEALTNALRHGDGRAVDIRMEWWADHVRIDVRNGVADAPREAGGPEHSITAAKPAGAAAQTTGHGLIGMRERAQLVGGTFSAAPDGRIFVVHAVIPVASYDRSSSAGGGAAGVETGRSQ